MICSLIATVGLVLPLQADNLGPGGSLRRRLPERAEDQALSEHHDAFPLGVLESGDYVLTVHSCDFAPTVRVLDPDGGLVQEWTAFVDTRTAFTVELQGGETYEARVAAKGGGDGRYTASLTRGSLPASTVAERKAREIASAQDCIEALSKEHGSDSVEVAVAYDRLAKIQLLHGKHRKALETARGAFAIHVAASGRDHAEAMVSAINLARMLVDQDHLDEALVLLEEALDFFTSERGTDPMNAAWAENVLGACHVKMGRLDSAREYLRDATEVNASTDTPAIQRIAAHSDLATSLLYQRQFPRALAELEKAVAISLEVPPGLRDLDHEYNLTTTFVLLGYTHNAMRQHAASIEAYERAVEICDRVHGDDHTLTAGVLNNLALALSDTHNLDPRSLDLIERAERIRRTLYHSKHPRLATTINNVGLIAYRLQNSERAEAAFSEALQIRIATLGFADPMTAQSIDNLASLYETTGDHAAAKAGYGRAAEMLEAHYRQALWSLSGNERRQYLQLARTQLDHFVTMARWVPDPEWERATYHQVRLFKARIAGLALASRDQLWSRLDDSQRELVDELHELQGRLSSAIHLPDATDSDIEALLAQRNRTERRINASVGNTGARAVVDSKQIVTSLPGDTVVVDFAIHRGIEVQEGTYAIDHHHHRTPPQLTAWVLGGGVEPLARVELGRVAPIREALTRYLALIEATDADGLAARRAAGRSAYEAIWARLEPHVAGRPNVILSPDGFLGSLPFEVLSGDGERFLVEDHAFVYVQDLSAMFASDSEDDSGGALRDLLCVGDVAFDAASEKPEPSATERGVGVTSASSPKTWRPLPETATEALNVVSHHTRAHPDGRRTHLTGAGATEEVLKSQLGRHSVLHLATHGFFRSGIAGTPAAEVHPGLLSGIVCAGANTPARGDDGLLTAEEVGWIDLSKVELVVLSACQTGLGEARSGEGMIGLRHAFRMAGARSVISSLWTVDDASTRELMAAFYANLWDRGHSASAALRAAQLETLSRQREAGHTDGRPASWGAFVVSGAHH
ncbi:MAG: CHAT domain-containing protein [bacterium]|nr:CHAT domain-containing protein [bacterium]